MASRVLSAMSSEDKKMTEKNVSYPAIQQPAAMQDGGNRALCWREWKSAFDYYLIASGREKSSSKEKCAVFLHVIGKYGREVFEEFDLGKDNLDYDQLVGKYQERFDPTKNVNFERHIFFDTYQKEKTFDNFISELKIKSKSCDFGSLKSSLILTQLIRGHKDPQMRERLLAREKLKLEEAEATCRAAERASSQAVACGSGGGGAQRHEIPPATEEVAYLTGGGARGRRGWNGGGRRARGRSAGASGEMRRGKVCANCSVWHSEGNGCPAYNAKCYKCNRVGHFAKCCKSKFVREVLEYSEGDAETDNEDEGEFYVDNISLNATDGDSKDAWYECVSVNNALMNFKLDSGADTSVMSIKSFLRAGFDVNILIKTNITLKEISKNKLPVVGYFMPILKYKSAITKQKIFVLDVECNNLLGLKACTELKLIARINEISKQAYDPAIFEGIGCLPNTIRILIDKSLPPVVSATRKIPIRLRPRLKEELDNMEKLDIIVREEGPTDWVSSLVIVEKPDKKLRVCLDPHHLNKAVRRSHFQLPTLDDIASEMDGAKYFSKLDANKGFWMLKLDTESSKLCTFSTPFGRYRFQRMPFGINCAPEIFHNEMIKIFKAEGVTVYIDDILVTGRTKSEHDARLKEVMRKACENGVKFNKDKCIFGVNEVPYLGHIFNSKGVGVDKKRIDAITNMKVPSDRKELERFLGMVNYLSRFIPNYSEIAAPLRNLLKKDAEFIWISIHDKAYLDLKQKICQSPVLRYYSPNEEVTVSVDASAHGLGACLLQGGRPVAYAARTLTPAEGRWAQIEKELLAIVFGCTRFHQYVYGHNQVIVETDHKPLESIFKKPLNSTPARLQRMLMKLQDYSLKIQYKPGKLMFIADTLSRAPSETGTDKEIHEDVTIHVNTLIENVSVSREKLQRIKEETEKDDSLQQITKYYLQGWPEHKRRLQESAKQYWTVKRELHVVNGIVFRNSQIVVPETLRNEMINRIHEGHLGIGKCKRRAKEVLWWPSMCAEIEKAVQTCDTCQRHRASNRREPLRPHAVPDLPWQVVAADIFDFDQKQYLLVVDYYSKYVEVAQLGNMTTAAVVRHLKNIFARFGIPNKFMSDNGPQFSSSEFKEFTQRWEIDHVTSSPLYPRSNGLAERNVQTVKKLMTKARDEGTDWQLALLNFRNTPIRDEEYSPAQLLMSRRLNTRLPMTKDSLEPVHIKTGYVRQKRTDNIEKTKSYYDHGTRPLPTLKPGEKVRMRDRDQWVNSRVLNAAREDRSYWLTTETGGTYRRNRAHIIKQNKDKENRINLGQFYNDEISNNPSNEVGAQQTPSTSAVPPTSACTHDNVGGAPYVNDAHNMYYTTRSGRQVRPPIRFT